MENLREQIELDLYDSIEKEWGIPIELTSPDGQEQIYSANNPTELLKAQVLYFTRKTDPETGEEIIVNQPVVSIRLTSLDRIPAAKENWLIKMPISPQDGAPVQTFVITPTRSAESGTDIGFERYYPQKIENDNGPEVLDDEISYN